MRSFPWYCPRCRRKEVRRAVIPYQCPRIYNGQPITVNVAELAVPRCGHCGELVFDYEAERQINDAYQAQTQALDNANGSNETSGLADSVRSSTSPSSSTK
jgi:hypothetical protein